MNNLKIGYAQVNINPQLGIGIEGYYVPRFAKGFLDDPVVDVLVLECGEKRIAMVSIPVCTFPKTLSDPWMENIEAVTGISKNNIFLSATHTHTGGGVRPNGKEDAEDEMLTAYLQIRSKERFLPIRLNVKKL